MHLVQFLQDFLEILKQIVLKLLFFYIGTFISCLNGTIYSFFVSDFAPTFKKNPISPNTYAARSGERTIVCNPESAPRATLVWKKNGRLLNPSSESSARVRQLANGNLHISNVRMEDQGNYTCEASNNLGTVESSGNLTVLGEELLNL